MGLYDKVILKPSDVKFTSPKILEKFDSGAYLTTLLADLQNDNSVIKDVPTMKVVWFAKKWEWYTLNNRLLWVLRQLQKDGKLNYVAMDRVELTQKETDLPAILFDDSELVHDLAEDDLGNDGKEMCQLSENFKALDSKDEEKRGEESDSSVEVFLEYEDEDELDSGGTGNPCQGRSRASSVCSSQSEGRGKDDWGRKAVGSPVLVSGSRCETDEAKKEEKCENPPVQPGKANCKNKNTEAGLLDDQKRNAVLEWVHGRQKFCRLYSNNYSFQEYVVQNMTDGASRSNMKASESLLSMDSAFSDKSSASLSSIARFQRQISLLSGYYGYGNFDVYNREYLSKLREERLASKGRLKPYDASGRRFPRSRLSSVGLNDDNFDCRSLLSNTVTTREEVITKRTYSETVHYRRSRSDSGYTSRRSTNHSVSSHYQRGYSYRSKSTRRESSTKSPWRDDRYDRCRARNQVYSGTCSSRSLSHEERLPRKSFSGSSTSLASYQSRPSSKKNGSMFQLKIASTSKDKLYELWRRRRQDYLQARYASSDSLASCCSLAVIGYTCGLCFKSFQTRNRLEQHSEELMHWGCITCGRFFASHTALGQHVEEVGHRKD